MTNATSELHRITSRSYTASRREVAREREGEHGQRRKKNSMLLQPSGTSVARLGGKCGPILQRFQRCEVWKMILSECLIIAL